MIRNATVRTPEESAAVRRRGERRARLALLRLLACASILRTALTRLVPMAGCGAWWLTLLCLLPGAAVYAVLSWLLYRTGTATLTELLRRCVGRGGATLMNVLLGTALLTEGLADMTALITLFTEGVGTRGTQWTLALLTGGVLACCLHREGLARGAYLLRPVLLGAAALLAVCALPGLRADGLFPMLGEGLPAAQAVLHTGWSLAWPLLLLLTLPEERGRARLRDACPVATLTVAALLLLTLTLPHERLTEAASFAGRLLQPARHASNALRMLWQCLLMLTLFLAVAASARLSADLLAASARRETPWLPWAVLAALTLSQTFPSAVLVQALNAVQVWQLLPFAVLTALCVPNAIVRRKSP
ncbi:MAG: hypothetical protein IJ343_08415 [Clostridia bacterium]|nr:hypothetical protein [Clostridia bacterium]